MKKLIEYELEDGTTVIMEAEDTGSGDGIELVSGDAGEEKTEKSQKTFSQAITQARRAADRLLESFKEANTPDEIALEFGLKFNSKAGAIFAQAGSEANFKVSLKWVNKKG